MISRAVPEQSRSRRGCEVVPPILRRRKSRGCLTVARYAIVVGRVPSDAKRNEKPDYSLSVFSPDWCPGHLSGFHGVE
jgi:hypothetical protein